jgi:hypothetical protein
MNAFANLAIIAITLIGFTSAAIAQQPATGDAPKAADKADQAARDKKFEESMQNVTDREDRQGRRRALDIPYANPIRQTRHARAA